MRKYSLFRYYLLFIYYKLRIIVDCSEGIVNILLSEFVHLASVLLHTWIETPGKNRIDTVTSIWGRFHFIGDLYSYLIMNPSFERPDMEYFISEIKKLLKRKKRILFLDIGANVGLYSVGIPNRIGKESIDIHSFEPDPLYFQLLQRNIKENNIKHITLHNKGLGDKQKEIKTPGFKKIKNVVSKTTVRFAIKPLDSMSEKMHFDRYDFIFIKIDIEGHEEEAIRGADRLFSSNVPKLLMIEDCVNPNIISYLTSHGFKRRGKITPYNSFWESPESI